MPSVRDHQNVVPFPAGGATDILVRLLAEEIGRKQGVHMLVETRPGAASVIGTEAVARAKADGNTLLINANSFVIHPSLRKLSYYPMSGFEPICLLAVTPMFIIVNRDAPYRTLLELLEAARREPGKLTLASLGPATAQHIAIESLKRLANADINFVPYSGTVPAINALLGGHVTSALANFPDLIAQANAGTARVLATTARTRVDYFSEVRTVMELGFNDYGAEVWIGLVAPAKTPQHRSLKSHPGSWKHCKRLR